MKTARMGKLPRPLTVVAVFALLFEYLAFPLIAAASVDPAETFGTTAPVQYFLQGQQKDGTWTAGTLCGAGVGDCYAEGDNVPFRLGINNLTVGLSYTVKIFHGYHDSVGIMGYSSFHSPSSADGTATNVTLGNIVPVGVLPNALTYDLSFTAQSATVQLNWLALLSQEAGEWHDVQINVRLVRGVANEVISNKVIPLQSAPIVNRTLSAAKTDSIDPVGIGGNTTYTITVTNGGEQSETVSVNDVLPSQFVYVDGSGTPVPAGVSLDERTIDWNGIVVAQAGSVAITFSALSVASGTGTNTATVTATGLDPVVATQNTTVTAGTLHVVKHISGGTATANQWKIHVQQGGTDVAGSPQDGSETGTDYTLAPGTYAITESDGPAGYSAAFSSECSGGTITVVDGTIAHCTITNNRDTGTLTVIKHVVNDNGGTMSAGNFTLHVSGSHVTLPSFTGSETGTAVTLGTGSYVVTEDPADGYAGSASADCAGSIAKGENKVCTVTNDDIAPLLTVTNVVVNDYGGTKQVSDFPLLVGTTSVESGKAREFSIGTYTVHETNQTGYTGVISGDCALDGSITLALADVKSCTITNTRDSGTLTVNTNFDDNGDGTVDRTNPAGWTWSIAGGAQNIPGGTTQTFGTDSYTMTAATSLGYSTAWSCSNGTLGSGANLRVAIAKGSVVVCAFTNTQDTGTISGVLFHDANANGVFDSGETLMSGVTVTLSNGKVTTSDANGAYTFTKIPVGTYTITVALPSGFVGTTPSSVSNTTVVQGGTATVHFGSRQLPATPVVEQDTLSPATTAPALRITKKASSKTANPGDALTYTVTVKNTGTAPAVNVTLSDQLATGFFFTDVFGTSRAWTIGTLQPGIESTITYSVTVKRTTAAGTYLNTATAKAENADPVSVQTTIIVKKVVVLAAETTEPTPVPVVIDPVQRKGAVLGAVTELPSSGMMLTDRLFWVFGLLLLIGGIYGIRQLQLSAVLVADDEKRLSARRRRTRLQKHLPAK